MADPFDVIERELKGGQTVSGQGRDPFDVLQAQLEQPYSGGAAFGGGFARGIPVVGPAIESGAQKAAAGIRSYMQGTPYQQEQQTVEDFARRATAANPMLATTGELAGATTAMGGVGATALGARALGAVGPNIATRIGASTLSNLGIGAADAAARGQDPETGATAGGLIGAAVPGVAGFIRGIASPFVNRPAARQAALDVLERADVPLRAGDITGSSTVRNLENALRDYPFIGPRTRALKDVQDLGYTSAVLRRAGLPVPAEGTLVRASTPGQPGTLAEQRTALDQVFNDITSRTRLNTSTPAFTNAINTNERQFLGKLPTEDNRIFSSVMDDIRNSAQNGLSGREYQDIRTFVRQHADAARREGADSPTSTAFRNLGRALDTAFEGSVSRQDAVALREAQRAWGNMRTLENAMAGGTERTAQGYVDPRQLQSAVQARAGGGRSGYSQGRGDLTELAQAGQAILRPLPESGTGRQIISQHMLGLLAGGAAGGAYGQDYPTALGGAVAGGVAGPYAFGRVLQSPVVQRYLANTAVTTPGVTRFLAGPLQAGRRTLSDLGE